MSVKLNPFTGKFDLVGSGGTSSSSDNFSYETIPLATTVTIPSNQQMIVHGGLTLLGTLVLDGMLVTI
jgi:hypothetical protein